MSNIILDAVNIHKAYTDANREVPVITGLDLQIAKGESLAIIGPSGAGKSTLLHVLGGLDQPTQGEVFLNGESLYANSDRVQSRRRNTKIGFVFQFYHLLPELNALENVIVPAMVKENKGDIKSAQAKGMELLEKVGLVKRFDHKPNQLSGGEQQRVAIARALMNDPEIIFCDEPTGNLDSKTGSAILDLLMKLNNNRQQTLVMVTHDNKIAQQCAKTMQIVDGKIK